jgi:hypothetical protein
MKQNRSMGSIKEIKLEDTQDLEDDSIIETAHNDVNQMQENFENV